MNDTLIVTAFVITDDLMRAFGHHSHLLAHAPDAEVVTVAIAAAACFQNHQERALCVMRGMGYLCGKLSISRFNRRIHALAEWLCLLLDACGTLFTHGDAFVIDSMPVPSVGEYAPGAATKCAGGTTVAGVRPRKRRVPSGQHLVGDCISSAHLPGCRLPSTSYPPRSTT